MSQPVLCKQCTNEIPADDVNIREGIVYCRSCGTLTRLADLLPMTEGQRSAAMLLRASSEEVVPDAALAEGDPPPGCWLREEGRTMVIRASARSSGASGGLLFFAMFWNSIVSLFVFIAIAGTLQQLGIAVPTWLPIPQGQNSMPLGMVLFLWLFLTPFIAIGLGTLGAALTTIVGRVEVRISEDRGVVLTGVGPLSWRRRFDALAVKKVTLGKVVLDESRGEKETIVIHAEKMLRFGTMLTEERRRWMAAVLQRVLVVQ